MNQTVYDFGALLYFQYAMICFLGLGSRLPVADSRPSQEISTTFGFAAAEILNLQCGIHVGKSMTSRRLGAMQRLAVQMIHS